MKNFIMWFFQIISKLFEKPNRNLFLIRENNKFYFLLPVSKKSKKLNEKLIKDIEYIVFKHNKNFINLKTLDERILMLNKLALPIVQYNDKSLNYKLTENDVYYWLEKLINDSKDNDDIELYITEDDENNISESDINESNIDFDKP